MQDKKTQHFIPIEILQAREIDQLDYLTLQMSKIVAKEQKEKIIEKIKLEVNLCKQHKWRKIKKNNQKAKRMSNLNKNDERCDIFVQF
jgi:hypothetical protein